MIIHYIFINALYTCIHAMKCIYAMKLTQRRNASLEVNKPFHELCFKFDDFHWSVNILCQFFTNQIHELCESKDKFFCNLDPIVGPELALIIWSVKRKPIAMFQILIYQKWTYQRVIVKQDIRSIWEVATKSAQFVSFEFWITVLFNYSKG
jgi:hypothetical protein